MTSESQGKGKRASSNSVNSVFDSIKSLLSDFRRDLPGYVEKVIQEKLTENPQYDNTDIVSLLAPIDNELGSQQQLDETIDAQSLAETRDIGVQQTVKENNKAAG